MVVVQPLHSSFTLRPSTSGPNTNSSSTHREQPELTLRESGPFTTWKSLDHNNNNKYMQPKRVLPPSKSKTRLFPFESLERRMLPFDFEPPTQESYWKKRCFQWQDICQQTRKRLRDTQEDQRQMRRRIRELEDQLLSSSEQQQTTTTQTQHGTSTEDDKEDSPAVSQVSVDRPPTMVTIPQNHKCKFYLTDGEALSDEEEYDGDDSWCRDDEEDEEDEDDEDDQSRQQ